MPEMRNYTVTEEREVKVRAGSAIDAANLANFVFRDEAIASDQVQGHIVAPLRVRDIVSREDF